MIVKRQQNPKLRLLDQRCINVLKLEYVVVSCELFLNQAFCEETESRSHSMLGNGIALLQVQQIHDTKIHAFLHRMRMYMHLLFTVTHTMFVYVK